MQENVLASNQLSSIFTAGSVGCGAQSAGVPTMTFGQTPVNDNANVSNTVHKGQTIIVTSEITIPPTSRCDINVTIMAPESPLSAVDLVITDVVLIGRNIPCLRKHPFVANVSSW